MRPERKGQGDLFIDVRLMAIRDMRRQLAPPIPCPHEVKLIKILPLKGGGALKQVTCVRCGKGFGYPTGEENADT